MAAQPQPPVWINLEYLSAEAYVERSPRPASPRFSGPGAGLTSGSSTPASRPATGGLLRTRPARHGRFDGARLAGAARLGAGRRRTRGQPVLL
jgi:hypothetical protein